MINRFSKCAVLFPTILIFFFNSITFAQDARSLSKYEQQRQKLNQNIVTIMGSQAKTSYTRFSQDMQNVLDDLKNNTIRVLPILGRGGGQNFLDTLFLQGIDMGIVERDVIDVFERKDPQLYGDVRRRLRYILKLANSEMHFFARHDIKNLEDLRGKKVSFYKPNSSSAQAIEKILGACNIEVERVYADTQLGAQKLRNGEIAAVGRISGAPHGALVDFTAEDGHFLPLDEENLPPGCYKRLMKMYLPGILKHEHYPKVLSAGQIVPTVANATILVTYNFPKKHPRYKNIANFVNKLFSNIDKLSEGPRHPKWKEVNIHAKVPGWTRFQAATDWINVNKNRRRANKRKLQPAFERFLSENSSLNLDEMSEDERRILFSQFVKWLQAQNATFRR